MSSGITTTNTVESSSSSVRVPSEWHNFTRRVITLMKGSGRKMEIGDGMKYAAYLKSMRTDLSFTDEEITNFLVGWVPGPTQPKAPKVKKERSSKGEAVVLKEPKEAKPKKERKPNAPKEPKEEPVAPSSNTVTVEDAQSVISVKSSVSSKSKVTVVKTVPLEDIQHILTAIKALKHINGELALAMAITSLQNVIDSH